MAATGKCPIGTYLKPACGKTVLPVVVNEGLWSMGTSMYSVFYGRLGDAAVAAVGIVNTVDQLIFTMIYGHHERLSHSRGQPFGRKR